MNKILKQIKKEAERSRSKYGRGYASQHEAYGVLLEEVDELWTEIKKKESDYDKQAMKKEAVQIASICLRFINEFC